MRLDFLCPNSGTKIIDADFNGRSRIICYKCKAIIILVGTSCEYFIMVKRLYDPVSHRVRENNLLPLHCPYCGKYIKEIRLMSKHNTYCPHCGREINTEITNDSILMKIKADSKNR